VSRLDPEANHEPHANGADNVGDEETETKGSFGVPTEESVCS
jgi:hypothetical protein